MDQLHNEIKLMMGTIDNKLDSIKEQTVKTNGRVSKLEYRQDKADQWQSYMQGGLSVISLLLVPILIYFITNWPK